MCDTQLDIVYALIQLSGGVARPRKHIRLLPRAVYLTHARIYRTLHRDLCAYAFSFLAGTKWAGKCWIVHNLLKYEFDLEFEIPVTYPQTAIELQLPELDGKTSKMYRGGKICLTVHFKPLWAKNAPKFGIAHALCLGLAPWMAAEIPHLVDTGVVVHKQQT